MQFRIRDEKMKSDGIVDWWLEKDNDSIVLRARRRGSKEEWDIVEVGPIGLAFYVDIGEDLGFPRDGQDRIVVAPD